MQAQCPFQVPNELMRNDALGSIAGTPIQIQKALLSIQSLFTAIPAPKPSDWLWDHEQEGQTYEHYKGHPMVNQFGDQDRKIIYIQPLELGISKEMLTILQNFTTAFYLGCQVVILKTIDISKMGITNRINQYTDKIQYNAREILRKLETKLPKDGYCMISILMSDLYPRDQWNFVFGLASLKDRTGVFSFARYDENFFLDEQERVQVDQDRINYRAAKVMVHEIGHMFGLRHCIYHTCIMTGSNHLEESDQKPLFECIVCMRKLQSNMNFAILQRYESLFNFCQENPAFFGEYSQFYQACITNIKEEYGPHYTDSKK